LHRRATEWAAAIESTETHCFQQVKEKSRLLPPQIIPKAVPDRLFLATGHTKWPSPGVNKAVKIWTNRLFYKNFYSYFCIG
jgi:hypothetical protein